MSKDAWQMGWEKGKLPLVTQGGKQGEALEQQSGIGASEVLRAGRTPEPEGKGSKVGRGFADLN